MTPLTRRHLFTLLTGAAAYAAAPDPVRRYFVIGRPEWRLLGMPHVCIVPGWQEKRASGWPGPRWLTGNDSNRAWRLVGRGVPGGGIIVPAGDGYVGWSEPPRYEPV